MIIIVMLSCTFAIIKQCMCIQFIDFPLPKEHIRKDTQHLYNNTEKIKLRITTETNFVRRHFLDSLNANRALRMAGYEDEKDENLKKKMAILVEQTLHDTARKIKSIEHIKSKYREESPYKAGFVLSLIKKSRDVLNELFNVAVKHKDDWKAMEQLKIFELIVHTNVDTTNLVRNLVEIHLQYLNSTKTDGVVGGARKRIVLL